MSLRQVWFSFVAAYVLAALALSSTWLYQHRKDADIQSVLVHAVADAVPLLLGIIFALWPQEISRMHYSWRVAILIGGLAWSGLLARRDYIDLHSSKNDLQDAVTTAVSSANAHSDSSISGLRQDLDNQVSKLRDGLTTGFNDLKPPPQKFAVLKFKFSDSDQGSISMHAGPEGVFALVFVATNVTDIAASNVDMWVDICQDCIFTKEPSGFDKPGGTPDTRRHKNFMNLNPDTSIETMTIEVKPTKPFQSFEVAWKYSCANCGKMGDSQKFKVSVLQPYKINLPKLTLN